MAQDIDFQLIYDGPAVNDGSIDVRALAPSLLGLSRLVDEANRLVTGGTVPAELRISREFEQGSFIANLAGAWATVQHLFTGNEVAAIKNIFSLLGINGRGLFQFIKNLRGKKIASVTASPMNTKSPSVQIDGDNNNVLIVYTDGTSDTVPKKILDMFQKASVVEAAADVTEPLLREGIDTLKIKSEGKETLSLDKGDAETFQKIKRAKQDEQNSSEYDVRLSIASVAFKHANKWRFSDGVRTFHAEIKDNEFIERTLSGSETFRASDTLHVRLRVDQWTEGGALKAKFAILKVYHHTQAADIVQPPLLPAPDQPAT